jgi:cytochrome c55X
LFSLLTIIQRGVSPAFILILVSFSSIMPTKAYAADAGLSLQRQMELVRLVRNDCGSCHGLTLKGGLGPALLQENLKGKAPEALTDIILYGRTGTAMPPWSAFVSEAEASWMVEQLMKGFPDVH